MAQQKNILMHENTTMTSSKSILSWNAHTICLPHQITPDDHIAPVVVNSGGAGKTRLMHHDMIGGTVREHFDA